MLQGPNPLANQRRQAAANKIFAIAAPVGRFSASEDASLEALGGSLEENCSQNKRESSNDLFLISANSTGRNDREQWTLDRRKRLLHSNIFVPEKRSFAFV
jgi:hypothetical protein